MILANATESHMDYEIIESHDHPRHDRRRREGTLYIEYTLYVNITGVHEEDISPRKQLKMTISKKHR